MWDRLAVLVEALFVALLAVIFTGMVFVFFDQLLWVTSVVERLSQ